MKQVITLVGHFDDKISKEVEERLDEINQKGIDGVFILLKRKEYIGFLAHCISLDEILRGLLAFMAQSIKDYPNQTARNLHSIEKALEFAYKVLPTKEETYQK